MKRNVTIREIYFYVICVIAIVIFIIGIVGLAGGIVNYIKPNTYMTKGSLLPSYQEQYPTMSDEELDKLIETEIANSVANERTYALKSIINNGIMIVIAIPLFAFHWKKAQELWRAGATE